MADAPSRSLVEVMVHDLKNPLAALAGNLALLREELGDVDPGPTGARCLDDAMALCDRVLAMVQSIADVDAAERGAMRVRLAPTRLRPLVDNAVALARVEAGTRELVIDVAAAADLEAYVDGRLLAQVVQNLVDNAVRYAPRRGRVVATITPDAGGGVVLSVGNSGPPLTADERTAVFEPGYRVAERAAGARRGRDFGLYFCRVVVEAHQGALTVEEHPGLPAVFVVTLPAA